MYCLSLIIIMLFSTADVAFNSETNASTAINYVNGTTPRISKKEQKLRSAIVKSARKYKGSIYKYGGTSPNGFDCSGFVNYVLSQYGFDGGRSSKNLASKGIYVGKHDVHEGDLIFFGYGHKINHVALVSKVSKQEILIIHSTSSKGVIEENLMDSPYWNGKYMFARDIISKNPIRRRK